MDNDIEAIKALVKNMLDEQVASAGVVLEEKMKPRDIELLKSFMAQAYSRGRADGLRAAIALAEESIR